MLNYIKIVEYSPEWEEMYERESGLISGILGNELVEIHHIGSTAVKGLAAKPVIDIMPVVKNIERVDRHNAEFEKLGYECMGELGIAGRRFFRKGGDNRTHHIHIFEESNRQDITRHLAVRDYLRTHEDARQAYGELKSKLAKLYSQDIEAYCDGKDDFVKSMEREALRWYGEG